MKEIKIMGSCKGWFCRTRASLCFFWIFQLRFASLRAGSTCASVCREGGAPSCSFFFFVLFAFDRSPSSLLDAEFGARLENPTEVDALRHRPAYELRAYVNQYICKLFFCAFFLSARQLWRPHFFFLFIYVVIYLVTFAYQSSITEHTLLELL